MRTWIVVADATVAHVFGATVAGGPMEPLYRLEHPEGRLRAHDLVTDRAGESNSDASSNRVHFSPAEGAVEHEQARFAARIAAQLDQGRRDGAYDSLWLVMPPRLLGRVRHELPKETERLVRGTLDRRMVQADGEELRARLQELR